MKNIPSRVYISLLFIHYLISILLFDASMESFDDPTIKIFSLAGYYFGLALRIIAAGLILIYFVRKRKVWAKIGLLIYSTFELVYLIFTDRVAGFENGSLALYMIELERIDVLLPLVIQLMIIAVPFYFLLIHREVKAEFTSPRPYLEAGKCLNSLTNCRRE